METFRSETAEQPDLRRLAWAAFAFSAGVFAARCLLPGTWLLPCAAAFLAVGLCGARLSGHTRLRVVLLTVGIAAGLAYSWAYAAAVQVPAETLCGAERSVSMTALDYADETRLGARITVQLRGEHSRSFRAVYYGDRDLLELEPGNTLRGTVRVESAGRIRDTDVTAFTSKGVFLLAYGGTVRAGRGSVSSPRWWPARLGRAMRLRIQALFSGDSAGFLCAMLTGDKSGLSQEAATDLSEAGIYHILAVSGLHCAFLFSMVEFFTGRHRRRLTAAAAVPVLLFYAVLAGCSPSVVRACIMLIALLAAPLFRRERDVPTAMASALALILLANPFAAASVSLQLSFAAIVGIAWAAPPIYRFLTAGRFWGKLPRAVTASLAASLGVTAFSAPLAAVYFHIFWLVLPLSNLLCLWAAGLIFCFGLGAVLLSFLCRPLGALLGLVPRVLIRYILTLTHWLSRLPYHAVYFTNPYLKYWLALVYLLFAVVLLSGDRTRRARFLAAALSAAALAATVWAGAQFDTRGKLNITALDVGQGQCIVLSSGNAFAMIDCGSSNSWYDAGNLAEDSLESMGCRRLQYLFLTHFDYDHVSGVTALLARREVGTLVIPTGEDDAGQKKLLLRAAEKYGVPVRSVGVKSQFSLGGAAEVSVLPSAGRGDNDGGLVFLCSSGGYDLLVTGDLDTGAERELLKTYALPDIETLVAGHHGARNASSQTLLDAVKPESGIVSVGSNAYGHPNGQTLGRLTRSGVRIYRTDLQGRIHICVN
jgi:competence protein ComEC